MFDKTRVLLIMNSMKGFVFHSFCRKRVEKAKTNILSFHFLKKINFSAHAPGLLQSHQQLCLERVNGNFSSF